MKKKSERRNTPILLKHHKIIDENRGKIPKQYIVDELLDIGMRVKRWKVDGLKEVETKK